MLLLLLLMNDDDDDDDGEVSLSLCSSCFVTNAAIVVFR